MRVVNTAAIHLEPQMPRPMSPNSGRSFFFNSSNANFAAEALILGRSSLDRPRWTRFDDSRGMLNPNIAMPLMLAALFILSFVFPILVAAHLNGFFDGGWEEGAGNRRELFPTSIAVGQNDGPITIPAGPGLDPIVGRDFMLVSWFKFRKVPISGDKVFLLTKFPDERKPRSGYALGLIDDNGVLRPMVYWSTTEGGRWYRFSEFEVPAKVWTMFAVSLREGRFLGLHVATVSEAGEADTKLLGGYDLGADTVAAPEVPITLAPSFPTRYISRIGPVGIFNTKDLTNELKDVVKEFAKTPLEIPGAFSSSDVGLWISDGKADSSAYKHAINLNSGKTK